MTKIMLAEDDPTMVTLLNTLLKMEGFQVIVLDSDANILKEVRHNQPDVLLLDVHLSNQNGLEVLGELRESDDVSNVKVVMTSGLNLKEECLAHGADDFLLKPYMPDELIAMLRRNIQPS